MNILSYSALELGLINCGYLYSAIAVSFRKKKEAPLADLTQSLEFETLALSEGVADLTVPLDKAHNARAVRALLLL